MKKQFITWPNNLQKLPVRCTVAFFNTRIPTFEVRDVKNVQMTEGEKRQIESLLSYSLVFEKSGRQRHYLPLNATNYQYFCFDLFSFMIDQLKRKSFLSGSLQQNDFLIFIHKFNKVIHQPQQSLNNILTSLKQSVV